MNDGAGQPPYPPKIVLIDSGGVAKVEDWQVEGGVDNVVISLELKKPMPTSVEPGYEIQVAVFSLKMSQDELY